MSYQVLARKWRPQVFDDVVGQGHITRTLQNAIASGRLAHAFLFSGPRGVGKTTTARILAKALNCSEGPTPAPCGKCDSCRETAAGTSVDVIEIDGASNRGIEHIRELREAVKYAPAGGKSKVYVIDEVHMLTNEAFNALLKTLEEPPPHVIFIFATTEPQKIPSTILSRCQRYGFKRVSVIEIVGRLRRIADAEGITVTDQGLALIARAAEGSMRDSQSLLDQAVSYSGVTITDEDLRATLGSVAQEALLKFTAGLLVRDSAGLLRYVDDLLEHGQDVRQFLSGVVEHIRNLLVVRIAADPAPVVELPAADIDALKGQAAAATNEQLLMLFDGLSKTLDEMRWSPHQRFTLEIGLIKACSLTPLRPLEDVLAEIKEMAARIGGERTPAGNPAAVSDCTSVYGAAPEREQKRAPAVSLPAGPGDDVWERMMTALRSKKPSLASFLAASRPVRITDREIVVAVKGSTFQIEQIEKPENRDVIEKIISEILGGSVKLRIQAAAAEAPPAPKKKEPVKKRPAEQDTLVQDALRIFGGTVVEQDGPEEEGSDKQT